MIPGTSCRKTGAARLSQADGWNAHVDSVPEGFKVVGFEYGGNWACEARGKGIQGVSRQERK
jgi:hypothetical protein